jgi:hypothetical protein
MPFSKLYIKIFSKLKTPDAIILHRKRVRKSVTTSFSVIAGKKTYKSTILGLKNPIWRLNHPF